MKFYLPLFNKKILVAHQHQKFRVICQVFDERLPAWTTVDPTVTENFLAMQASLMGRKFQAENQPFPGVSCLEKASAFLVYLFC